MKNSTKILLSVVSIAFLSGCNIQQQAQNAINNVSTQTTIDASLPQIEKSSIKLIPDISEIALEWGRTTDKSVTGYYVYRSESGGQFAKIDKIDSRYASHYVDKDLKPDTLYAYKISTFTTNAKESNPSLSESTKTLAGLEQISLFKAISNLPRQVKLLWRPYPNERIAKYEIERKDLGSSNWSKIATVQGKLQSEYIDNRLGDGVTYLYRIKAVTFDGIASTPTPEEKATTKPLPFAPTNIQATTNLPKKIKLTWSPSTTKDVVEYKIYRGYTNWAVFTQINDKIPANAVAYEDLIDDDGANRFYKISAIDADDLESKIAETSTMGTTLPKPAKPKITLAQIAENKVILNWEPADNRAKEYKIYKTIKEAWYKFVKNEFPKVKSDSSAQIQRLEDKDILRGVEYKYTVVAIDENGLESPESDEAVLILPETINNQPK